MSRMNEQCTTGHRGSIFGLVVWVAPALAAEVEYDPGDTVYFTYCHAHPPALRINPATRSRPAPGTRRTTCSDPPTRR